MSRLRIVIAATLAAGLFVADAAQAAALPPPLPIPVARPDAVQYRPDYQRRPPYSQPGYRRPPPQRYWHGYRGYDSYRPGYRRNDDGWWYPLAAFGLGAAIVGGMMARPAPSMSITDAHVRWCLQRYRSYRMSDNTYQPYGAPRRICVSPYSR